MKPQQRDKVTTVDILRHGKTEGGEIFRGSTDLVLNTEGWQQMQDALDGVEGWQQIITSPMQRCLQFARELAGKNGIAYDINENLREISFGDWDGKSFAEIKQNDAGLFHNFWRDPVNHTPPNAESIETFCIRVSEGFWQEIGRHQGKHVLLVVHGGVVRALLSEVLQTSMHSLMRFDVPYACLTRIKIYHDDENHWPQLVFHNR